MTPDSAPQDEATDNLVDRLRSDVVPAATEGGDAVAYVSGLTAAFKDIGDRIMERLPLFLLYIIGVTFIVLAMAFRSIVISLTAAITTILSAFVAFGVLTLVVQEGHLLGLTGLDRTGPIETFVPPIAFAILFGLSMDYMVFLMSRIREEHVHGLKTREAVEHGISAIGRVVVAAALIMGTVFAAFILSGDRVSKEFGILLAVAILIDALLVRMTLVPSFLTLLGEKSWYIPRWLDRLLPNLTIEPPHDGEAPAPVAVGEARAERSMTHGRAGPSGSARLRPRGGAARPARRLRPQGGRIASCDRRTPSQPYATASAAGRRTGRVRPARRASALAPRRARGACSSAGFPPERRGGRSGNARQRTPAAPACLGRAARDASTRRAAARHERQSPSTSGAHPLDDREPGRVELWAGAGLRRPATRYGCSTRATLTPSASAPRRPRRDRARSRHRRRRGRARATHAARPRGGDGRAPCRAECRRRASARSLPGACER